MYYSLLEQVLNGGAARLDSLELHNKVWDLTTQAILTAVVDYHMLGSKLKYCSMQRYYIWFKMVTTI